jgi:hypothetical protein
MSNIYNELVAQLYYLVNDNNALGDVQYYAEHGTTTEIMDRAEAFLRKSSYTRISEGYLYYGNMVSATAVAIAMMWHLYGVDAHFTVSTMMAECDSVYKIV